MITDEACWNYLDTHWGRDWRIDEPEVREELMLQARAALQAERDRLATDAVQIHAAAQALAEREGRAVPSKADLREARIYVRALRFKPVQPGTGALPRDQWRVWWINDRGEKREHVCATERDALGMLERVRQSERGVIGWQRESVTVLPLPDKETAHDPV